MKGIVIWHFWPRADPLLFLIADGESFGNMNPGMDAGVPNWIFPARLERRNCVCLFGGLMQKDMQFSRRASRAGFVCTSLVFNKNALNSPGALRALDLFSFLLYFQ